MTHVLVLSAKVRRNEPLWHTLDIGIMFGSTFGFKDYRKLCNPPHFYLPTRGKFAPPYTSLDLAQSLLSDQITDASTLHDKPCC